MCTHIHTYIHLDSANPLQTTRGSQLCARVTRLDPLKGGSHLLGALHHEVRIPPVGGHHPVLLKVAQENRALRLRELLRTYTRARARGGRPGGRE